jgi:K+ transporter
MALIALVVGHVRRNRAARLTALVAIGIFGAALFFGDATITPAISVLSAVEDLKVVQPSLAHFVVPISATILIGLFALQRRGSAAVGRLFGPVMLVWFIVLALLGVHGIVGHPGVLRALLPTYGVQFFLDHGLTAFLALGVCPLDPDEVTDFLSKIEIKQTDASWMAAWRKRLFLAARHIPADAGDYFQLPRPRPEIEGPDPSRQREGCPDRVGS